MVNSKFNVVIDTSTQRMSINEKGMKLREYTVSTARNGVGQLYGSECTPLGRHIIRAKIGEGMPENTVFVARRPTGELYNDELANKDRDRDWILTRILWLSGLEPGHNRLGDCDTMRRFIYIHGCPGSHVIGIPDSHGCIKLHNKDVIEVFDLLPVYTEVLIK